MLALAARVYRPFGGDADADRGASTTFLDTSFTLGVVLGVTLLALAVVFGVWIWMLRLRASARRSDWEQVRTLLAVVLMAGLVALAFGNALMRWEGPPPPEANELAASLPEGAPTVEEGKARPARDPQVVWPLVIAVAVLAAGGAAAVAFVVMRRRRQRELDADQALAEVEAAAGEAIDDLRHERDPRKAVIAAYARMERVLAACGLPRRPAESPYEYVARAAAEADTASPLRSGAAMWGAKRRRTATFAANVPPAVSPAFERPMSRLTVLFEEAKFSEHAVGEPMREQALDALTAIRDEAQLAAATPAGAVDENGAG